MIRVTSVVSLRVSLGMLLVLRLLAWCRAWFCLWSWSCLWSYSCVAGARCCAAVLLWWHCQTHRAPPRGRVFEGVLAQGRRALWLGEEEAGAPNNDGLSQWKLVESTCRPTNCNLLGMQIGLHETATTTTTTGHESLELRSYLGIGSEAVF